MVRVGAERAFVKAHGLGNDFALFDLRDENIPDLPARAKGLLDRRFGIGADQLLTIENSDRGDYKMRIFNSDGSEVEMCGNGIRCVARYLFARRDRKFSAARSIRIETLAGIITPRMISEDMVEVDMGRPSFETSAIPALIDQREMIDHPITIERLERRISAVSMGNPHAVIFSDDDIDRIDLPALAAPIESATDIFPNRINVHFARVLDRGRIKARFYERGAGATLACGTGASAIGAVAVRLGLCDRSITVEAPGGEMRIDWRSDDEPIYMTGPAVEVYTGRIKLV